MTFAPDVRARPAAHGEGARFDAIADSLRAAILDHCEQRGEPLRGSVGSTTLETNSGFVERRAAPLLLMLRRWGSIDSVADLRVADLGCGFGALAAYFAHAGAVVTGVDRNAERLEVGRRVAARHGLRASFEVGRMESLELPDRAFDIALANNSLCYVVSPENRRAALSEALRILRPGGTLLLRNPNPLHPLDQFTQIPLLALLPPAQAVAVARRLGHDRSLVRLRPSWAARRELELAGYVNVVVAGFVAGTKPDWLRAVARYQHLLAFRPPSARA